MALSKGQASTLLRRANAASDALARARKNAKEDAAGLRDAAAAVGAGALVGGAKGWLGREDLIRDVTSPIDLVVGVAALGFSVLGTGSKTTRDVARSIGAGALAVFAARKVEQMAADMSKDDAASTSGEIIGRLPSHGYGGGYAASRNLHTIHN